MEQKIHCSTATISELKRGFYHRIPIEGITAIGTHYGPHNDELCGAYLLRETPQGKRQFPGIEKASFGPVSATELRERNILGEEGFFLALKAGILLIGIGGGPLDEHDNRKEKISCTERVGRLLDLMKEKDDRKVYGRLITYVNYEDGNGDNLIQNLSWVIKEKKLQELDRDESEVLQMLQIGAFAQNLKKGFEAAGDDVKKQQEIYAMAFQFYKNEINQAKMFLEAEKAYGKPERLTDLTIPKSKHPFVLLEIKSDIPIMNKVAHSKWRENRTKKLGVLFLHKTNGQFVLMPNQQHITPTQMREVAKIIRQKIAYVVLTEPLRFTELEKDQIVDDIPQIHFDENTGIICNGSKTDPQVPGIIGKVLSVEAVIEAVQIGLDTNFFPQRFRNDCRKGKCVKGACWMYQFGQQRCYDVRNNEKVATSPIGSKLKEVFDGKKS